MRVIMIGCGRIAQIAHLPAINRVEGIELVAVVDPSPELGARVARKWGGVPSFTSTAEAYHAVRADAVVIGVPDRLHAALASEAMDRGLHVLVEKPLAGNLEDAEAMKSAAERTGRVLQVGNMRRHDPGVIAARRYVAEEIGDILSFAVWYRPSATDSDAFWGPLITDPTVSATEQGFKSNKDRYWPYTYGSHMWDTVRYVVGEVGSVSTRFHRNGESATWQSLVTLDTGAVGTVDLTCYEHGDGGEGVQVRGTRGTVTLNMHNPFSWRASDVSVLADSDRVVHSNPQGYANAFELQLRSFLDATAGSSTEAAAGAVADTQWERAGSPDDGIQVVRLIEAMVEAAAEQRTVELG